MAFFRNGAAFSWAGTRLNIAGVDIVDFQGIKYEQTQEIVPIYGQGTKPISYAKGNIEYSGSFTVLMESVLRFQEVAPNGDITQIPLFNIPVLFKANGQVKIDRLEGCLFKQNVRDVSQGQTSIPVELELFIGNILWAK